MLALNSFKGCCSPKLYQMIQRFVVDKMLEALDIQIDMLGEADKDYYIIIFPEAYVVTHSVEECFYQVKVLRNRLASNIEYERLSPLSKYILYHALESRIDDYILAYEVEPLRVNELGVIVNDNEEVRYILPKELKEKIVEEFHIDENSPTDIESENYNEGFSIIWALENANDYTFYVSEDTDFLEIDIRAIVQLAVTNNPCFLSLMTYDDLDSYMDVMPLDVLEDYKNYRKEQVHLISGENKEKAVIDSILNALQSFSQRIIVHKYKGEVELTADLQERIEQVLTSKNINIAREYTLGRAKKNIGETDLYFSSVEEGRKIEIAILENKVIESFDKQYLQLMGYLNSNFLFGITLSINKNMPLNAALTFIKDKLEKVEGDFKPLEIYDGKDNLPLLVSKHKVPETGNEMAIYHFVLNLYDKEREEAALQARI